MARDCLKELWCCLSCSAKFPAGEIISKPSTNRWHCPKCDSTDLMAADGQARDVPEYFGDIPEIRN